MVNPEELSIKGRENIYKVINNLNECRKKLDEVMYCYDRDMSKQNYSELRSVYDSICKALDRF